MQHRAETAGRPEREPSGRGRDAAAARRVVIPLVDEQERGRIYDASIHRFALAGGLIGALTLGLIAALVAEGALPVAGLGQLAAAGTAPAAFAGGGVGLALGALLGALAALYRIPPRRVEQHASGGE